MRFEKVSRWNDVDFKMPCRKTEHSAGYDMVVVEDIIVPSYLKIVSEKLKDVIENQSSPILSIIKKAELEKLLNTDKNEPWYGQLMTTPQTIAYFLQINYWLEKYKIIIK